VPLSLPAHPAELTATWLSDALQARHPGARVAAVQILEEHGSTNHHVRLGLAYHERAGAPDSLFVKMASLDPGLRAMIGATGMGAREARFYNELAPTLSLRTPTSYYAASDREGRFLLLLEDLRAAGCRFSDGTWGLSADLAAGGLSDLAQMHVSCERPDRLTAVAPWILETPPGNVAFTTAMLRRVFDEHRALLSRDYVAIGEMYIATPEAVLALWQHEPHTVVHGDAHLGNVFVDGERVGFLDWGLIAVAPALRDMSYFISLQLTAAERRSHERDLVRYYLGARAAAGGSPISFDDAWRAHRIHAGYLVLASFLSLVPPYNGPDQRSFSDAFRNRAIEAIADLGSADALRAALG
jgi:hypothetical protein